MNVDNQTLSSRVGDILGSKVNVNLEGGSLTVLSLETFQFLLHTSKLPKSITPEWIIAAIERKAKTAADVKARRAEAADKLRGYMQAHGIQADGAAIYFTSFGFSVENLFRNGMEEAKRIITESGIAFKRLEYSGAHWVVRVIL